MAEQVIVKTRAPGDRFTSIAIAVLLTLLVAMFFFPQTIVTVYPGEAGVLWDRFFGGTRTDVVYGEGVHLVAPWNHFYKYDVRLQEMTSDYETLAQTGLMIKITASVRYRPAGAPFPYPVNRGSQGANSLGELHKRVGPDYPMKVVVPVVASLLRQVIGRYQAEELYHLRSREVQDQVVAEIANRRSKSQLAEERFVDILDVLIRNVVLPPQVSDAIEKRLSAEQLMLAYDFTLRKEQKEAERKSIEAEGIRRFQEIVTRGIQPDFLRWKGIEATLELARSPNAKVVVIGGRDGLPLILNLPQDGALGPTLPATPPPSR